MKISLICDMQGVKVVITKDGSRTLFVPNLNEHYHSMHGAINEAQHVYIKNGLINCKQPRLTILEVGFGTGLNAFLAFMQSQKTSQKITYFSVENNPLKFDTVASLDYPFQLGVSHLDSVFQQIHTCPWNMSVAISQYFFLHKIKTSISTLFLKKKIDLVFYDAFCPRAQKELWTKEVFALITGFLNKYAVLVTYCANGQVKRNLKDVGFEVKSLKGPPGKREMIQAKWIK